MHLYRVEKSITWQIWLLVWTAHFEHIFATGWLVRDNNSNDNDDDDDSDHDFTLFVYLKCLHSRHIQPWWRLIASVFVFFFPLLFSRLCFVISSSQAVFNRHQQFTCIFVRWLRFNKERIQLLIYTIWLVYVLYFTCMHI